MSSSGPGPDIITERLDRLERENRRLKGIGILALAGLGIVALTGQTTPRSTPRVVEAEQFVVKDAQGVVRAVLGAPKGIRAEPRPQPVGLVLYGPKGEHLVRLLAGDGDPSAYLSLYDPARTAVARVMASRDYASLELSANRQGGSPEGLSIRDAISTVLVTAQDNGPDRPPSGGGITLGNKNAGEILLQTEKGSPGLSIFDGKGNARLELRLEDGELPSVQLRDEQHNTRAVIGHTELEMTRTGSVERRPASSVVLFDKDGKVLWRAP